MLKQQAFMVDFLFYIYLQQTKPHCSIMIVWPTPIKERVN